MSELMIIGNKEKITTEISVGLFNELKCSDYSICMSALKGDELYFGAELSLTDNGNEQYIYIPGAVYDGNRFQVLKSQYPPFYQEENKHQKITISDIPRLDIEDDQPELSITTGDCSVPVLGVWDKKTCRAYFMYTDQGTLIGDSGLHVIQDKKNGVLRLQITAPFMRKQMYRRTLMVKSDDTPRIAEESVEVVLRIRFFDCACNLMEEFYDLFMTTRNCMTNHVKNDCIMPATESFRILEEKYNEKNYCSQYGFYAAAPITEKGAAWRLGWGSGGILSYAMLLDGHSQTMERALKCVNFMINTQEESGFFPGNVDMDEEGRLHLKGDVGTGFYTNDSVLVRRNADALYYMIRTQMLLESRKIKTNHLEGAIKKLCDTFEKLFHKYGQLGQFVNKNTGEITIGNSTSGAIVCAGLALCGSYYKEPKYITLAEKIGDYFYEEFLSKGYTGGGPGEALMNPDSESSYGLVESYVALYEETKCDKWLKRACFAANMFASWCVSYDYVYRNHCEFQNRGVKTTGAVMANTQNKHGAPAICTHSGFGLLKLYRHTLDYRYLQLYEEISHNIAQYLSTRLRPMKTWDGRTLPEGYMCERVNLSDWEGLERVGGVFFASNWCEVSLMLTCAELPGVYVDAEHKRVACSDHIMCEILGDELLIKNETPFDASVKLLIDSGNTLKESLPKVPKYKQMNIKSGESIKVKY